MSESESEIETEKHFVLAIDAGGTKTLGLLKCLESEETWCFRAGSASLSYNLSNACQQIFDVAQTLLQKASCPANQVVLVCGVAGAGNSINRKALEDKLNPLFHKVIVSNDGRTSLYGAGLGDPMIVLAMGTGSVAMRLDKNKTETQFGGWGFIAGDLGSGAYMGKQLVSLALVQLDKQQLKCDILMNETVSRMLSKQQLKGKDNKESKEINQAIAEWIQNATATEYASFAPLIFEYADQSIFAQKILKDAALWIEDLAETAGYKSEQFGDIPITIIGGLAQAIKPYLSNEFFSTLVSAKGSALDGALFIGEEYLLKKKLKKNKKS
jgi:glucosamine kinase